ncbi:hypothetical protein [Nocardia sp. AG03]|uniref:hypothetical protein n=1 Tax=Nocardia sp. AG03 TaxID=3025312 RepID=UPI0024181E28|nr:hypothetical protein [Nocardia sp. AG03]
MSTFQTPRPIDVTVELMSGDLIVVATDRTDSVVVVQPADPSSKADVRAAENTTVDCTDGALRVTTPKSWRTNTPFGGNPTIVVRVEVPAGSTLTSTTGVGRVLVAGEIGRCDLTVSLGDITIEHPRESVTAKTAKGDIRVGEATRGEFRLETSLGELEVGVHPGSAVRLETTALLGAVRNRMVPVDATETADTVAVYARNSLGDIVIRHTTAA